MTTEQIKGRLKAKFPKANFSKDRLDALAAGLKKGLTDDSTDEQIDAAIDFQDSVFSFEDIAKADDRARTPAPTPTPTPAAPAPTQRVDEEPQWAKDLKAMVLGVKAENVQGKFNSDERLKHIPEQLRSKFIPASDEDYEQNVTALTELATQLNIQSVANSGLTPASTSLVTDPVKLTEEEKQLANEM